jgi:hypothetical protein
MFIFLATPGAFRAFAKCANMSKEFFYCKNSIWYHSHKKVADFESVE